MQRRTPLIALLLAAGACLAGPGSAAAAELFYGVDEQNRLVTFSGDTPGSITRVPITGPASGEQIVGIDIRPANQQIVALSNASRLYRITPATGAATVIGPAAFAPGVTGTAFGFDFNPTVDRIRAVSDTRQNLRLHPDTGAVAATDGTLAYAATDAGAAATPRIVGSAYTNSVAGATTTSLYGLDAGRDALVLQNPPNPGTLATVGSLGVDITDLAGFDIAATDGAAYASLQQQGQAGSRLYRIDLTTGRATDAGRIGGGVALRALTAAGTAPADTAAPGLQVTVTAPRTLRALVNGGIGLRASCTEGCTVSARVLNGSRQVANAKARTIDLRGDVAARAIFTTAAKKSLQRLRSVRLTIVVTARDAAGNVTTVRRQVSARR